MTTNSVHFHRVLRTTPEKLYRAFTDADAYARWLPPCGFTAKVHHMDVKIGGSYKMSFTNFSTGNSFSFGGTYIELIPNERVCYATKFDDPNLSGEMRTTVEITPVSCGVEVKIKEEGIPAVIPVEACHLGWQESLEYLAKLVEPDIRDE